MKRRTLRRGIYGLAATALAALTACSSNSSAGSAAPAASGTQAGASGPASSQASGSTAHGSPISLVFLTTDSSRGSSGDGFTGIQAAVKYINAQGGIHGHPLIARECVDSNDPNLAAACATKTANDANIIASVDQLTQEGSVVDPVLEHAGLPAIGANALVSADFNAPDFFTTEIGGLAGLGAVAAAADLLHAKKISFVYTQSPGAATEISLLDSVVLTPRKLPPLTTVGIPITAGDLSAAVAKASQGSPAAIVTYTSQSQSNSFVKAARQQGVTTPILISAALESPSAVQQQLGSGENVYFYTWFKHSGQFYNAFLSQWQASGNPPALADELAINGWLSVTMFAQVARTLPTVTRASVMQAFSKLSNYSTDGLLPPLSFDKPGTFLNGQAPRIINPTMGLSQYQNGTFAAIAGGKFTNPFIVP
jgi:ABC-type branched-subunit amino acid transport system substrate-binding protein